MNLPSTLIGCLLRYAERTPDRCAIASRPFSLSYAELAQRVITQAQSLSASKVSNTAVVGIACADDVQHLILCLAAAHLGATSCTIPTFESPQQRDRIVKSVGITHVIGDEQALDLTSASESNQACSTRETATGARFLFSTSGTTGEPKIVTHADTNLVTQAPRHVVSTAERFACLASIEHNFAKRHRLYCVAQGATNVFLDPGSQSIVEQCQSLNVTTMHLSAFQAQEFLAIPDIGALRGIRLKLGGSHVPAELRKRLRESITQDLYCGYGTTETGAIAFTDPNDSDAAESVGRALPGIEIRVTDADRRPLAPGERGEIAIRCAGMFHAYWNQPDATHARLVDDWFHTGDTGFLDDQHRLHLSGRTDDMFVFNSINIYPQDIEAQICQYPSVVDAAVLPKHSPVHGDVPVALVVFEEGVSPDLRDLKQFVRDSAGLRTPRQFTIVDRIPRNATGKILRAEAQLLLGTGRND